MTFVESLLPEFDHEMATTRKLLERVPDDRLGWKPHAKSWSLGQLAQHVATIPLWGGVTLTQSELDITTTTAPEPAASRVDLLHTFDASVSRTRTALVGCTDAALLTPWALRRGTQTMFSMPKLMVWRSFVMNHLVHHRGQLALYLRMNDVLVPPIYGPSADESAF